MGINDIIESEPMYAGHYERARDRIAHQQRQQRRVEAAGGKLPTPDGGVEVAQQSTGASLSIGDMFHLEVDDYEPFIAGLLVANTAMTAGVLLAVLIGD